MRLTPDQCCQEDNCPGCDFDENAKEWDECGIGDELPPDHFRPGWHPILGGSLWVETFGKARFRFERTSVDQPWKRVA